MKNSEIAAIFAEMADAMEIQGENPFRVNSYRRVAQVLEDLTEDVDELAAEGRLTDVPGVGKSSAAKIAEYLKTGAIRAHQELARKVPPQTLELLRIPGLGPKTVSALVREAEVASIDELEQALGGDALTDLPGMGAKKLENIRKGLEHYRSSRGRALLGDALETARHIVARLKEDLGLDTVEPAGSLRRRRETVGDLDILVTLPAGKKSSKTPPEEVVKAFTHLDVVRDVLAEGDTKGSIRTHEGMQVDLRVVPAESYGAALQYFTGSKAHNVHLRGLAKDAGLKISEYGVFEGQKLVAGATEEEVYRRLKLPFIEPELREDRGEIEAAMRGELPELVRLDDIRGDLQSHTDYSDGHRTLGEMARLAKEHGYEYLAVTDHSRSLTVANGMTPARFRNQMKEIDLLNKRYRGFRLLKGIEVDILEDGALDMPKKVLAEADIVLAAVHSRFKQDEEKMTRRILKAVRNPLVNVIAHPTGRLMPTRGGYAVDVGRLIEECARTGTVLEINAHQERLDLNDVNARRAVENGVALSIGTDAHHESHFWMMELGVAVARRAWCGRHNIINCMSAQELIEFLSRKRRKG